MPEAQITNPEGAYGDTATEDINPRTVDTFVSGGAIGVGDLVVFDALTAEGDATVSKADVSADNPALCAGIAKTATTASGQHVQVVTRGVAVANCGDATIAAGDIITFHGSTDGAVDGTAGTGSTVQGDYIGIALSAQDVPGTNEVIIWIDRV